MQEPQETSVISLGWEDPLEEGMATRSSILAENPMDRGAWRAAVHRGAKSRARLKGLSMHAHKPLMGFQISCGAAELFNVF